MYVYGVGGPAILAIVMVANTMDLDSELGRYVSAGLLVVFGLVIVGFAVMLLRLPSPRKSTKVTMWGWVLVALKVALGQLPIFGGVLARAIPVEIPEGYVIPDFVVLLIFNVMVAIGLGLVLGGVIVAI